MLISKLILYVFLFIRYKSKLSGAVLQENPRDSEKIYWVLWKEKVLPN